MAKALTADKPWTHMRVEHAQSLGLIPNQYRIGRAWVRGKRGYGLAMGRMEELILGFPLKLF